MATDSGLAIVHGAIGQPAARGDSGLAIVHGAIGQPSQKGDSGLAIVHGSVESPHHPAGFWDGSQIRWTPIRTWSGSAWV